MTTVLNYDTRRRLRSLRADTLVLLATVSASLLIFLAQALGGILMAHLWYSFAAGQPLNVVENDMGTALGNVGRFAYLSVLVVFPLLILWMYLAHRRLLKYSPKQSRYSSLRVVLAWVMPRSFIIAPFYVMKEIYVVSRGISAGTFTPICGCWWGFWLAAMFLNLAQFFRLSTAKERGADLYILAGISYAISTVPVIVAGACLMVIVWRVDRAQARRENALTTD